MAIFHVSDRSLEKVVTFQLHTTIFVKKEKMNPIIFLCLAPDPVSGKALAKHHLEQQISSVIETGYQK